MPDSLRRLSRRSCTLTTGSKLASDPQTLEQFAAFVCGPDGEVE